MIERAEEYAEFCGKQASEAYDTTGVPGVMRWSQSFEQSLAGTTQQIEMHLRERFAAALEAETSARKGRVG